MMVDFGAEMAEPCISAHFSIFDAWGHLSSVGVGTGNSEIIGIGVVEKVDGLGKCGSKEVEQGKGYTRALRNPVCSIV